MTFSEVLCDGEYVIDPVYEYFNVCLMFETNLLSNWLKYSSLSRKFKMSAEVQI